MTRRLVGTLLLVALVALAGLPAFAGDTEEEARLREHLEKATVNLSIDDQPLAEVVKLVRIQTGLNVMIDPRILSDVGDLPVRGLHVSDLPLEKVLNMLADAAGDYGAWTVMGNVVVLTARELLPRRREVHIYPVAGLVTGRTDFAPAEDGLVGGIVHPPNPDPYRPYGTVDELMELIRNSVEPQYWEDTEYVDMGAMGEGRLLVKADPFVHAGIDRFLARLENLTPDVVQVEVYAVAPTTVPAGAEAGPLGDDVARAILARDRSGPALTLAVRKHMQSTVFAGAREAYVRGHEAWVSGPTPLLDPEIGNLEVGMAACVRALPDPQGNHLLLELDVAVAAPTSKRMHQDAAGDEVALPARTIVRRDGMLLLEPGRWHWSEGRAGGEDPARWGFLVRATPVRAAPGAPRRSFQVPAPRPPAGQRLLADRRVKGLDWQEASLDQVVTYLRTITGLNFYITPRVREEVFDEVQVTLNLDDASVATVLDLVTEPYELSWRLDGNLIAIDLRRPWLEKMQIRYFDVQDLCARVAPAQVAPSPDYAAEERPPRPAPIYAADMLVEIIRRTIGHAGQWEDPAAIEARNGMVIARNTPVVLDTIERLLGGLRNAQEMVVTIVDLIEMDDGAWQALGGDALGARPLLDAGRVEALDGAVAAGKAVRLSRERLVSLEGSGTPRASGEEIPYVADYDVRAGGTAGPAAPVRRVATLHSGTLTQVRSILGYPSDSVELELTMDRTLLTEMGDAATPYGDVDLPHLDVWSVATGLRVPAGRTALVSARRRDGRWRLLLATPMHVSLESR